MADDLDDGVIEVQVIPQDDNWGETATTITETATSYCPSFDGEYDTFDEKPKSTFAISLNFEQVVSILLSSLLGLLAIFSPIAFVVLPILKWDTISCGTSCDGHFISLGVKILILIVGVWALYFNRRKAVLPRFNVLKISVMALIFIVIVCFWLFYAFRVIEKKERNPQTIMNYAVSFADSMLFLHYLSVILLWLRQRYKVFTIKVIRNVDGACKHYNVGQLSIQKAASLVLEKYFRDFGEYNPHLERPPSRAKAKQFSNLKFYDLDGGKGQDASNIASQTRAVLAATARRREGRNDRFYEEAEFEKRVKKRRARLLTATEEAFGHVARMNLEKCSDGNTMESDEAAQAIFPTLARPLQKYLRTTRQQPRFTMESIIKHLAHCINNDLSPKAFLEKYMNTQPCITFSGYDRKQEWSLVSADSPQRYLREGCVFQLKKEDICLVVTVRDMPVFTLTEDAFDFENNKFVLRLNSETSV
eukprot:gene11173-12348_t